MRAFQVCRVGHDRDGVGDWITIKYFGIAR
jgi:hypothetical protein